MPVTLSGSIRGLIQAVNGWVLAGSSDAGKIFYSLNNGVTWELAQTLGSGSDRVNAFAKANTSGTILAAVSGSSTAQGIWRSTNNGLTWTKVKSHPSNTGYLDIASFQEGNRFVAVGFATPSNHSPMVYSADEGSNWQNISGSYYRNHIAVASTIEQVLPTYYSGEWLPGALYFIGVDSYYTEMYGANNTLSSIGYSTEGGGAGQNGLDMAVFLIKNSANVYNRIALWAVKSAADVNNTEIWGWPTFPIIQGTNPKFSKVATIPGKIFNVLYPDPLQPGAIGSLRTIWAGANGEIWISANNGLTWAVATTAPNNQIRSFLRLTSGSLLAGGDNGELFIYIGSQPGEGGGGTTPPPEPTPVPGFVASTKTLGREATATQIVPVANKSSYSNVTHIFKHVASTYTHLQFDTDPPYQLFGDIPVPGDAVYFGSRTNDPNVLGGTFNSLVFNTSQISQNLVINWQYFGDAGWENLTFRDDTSGFKLLGEHQVTWIPPDDWTITDINGVTGYWIRVIVPAVNPGPVSPIHDGRYIYTQLLPYVTIAEQEIGGTIPALAKISWANLSDGLNAGTPNLNVDRVVMGLRSLERGPVFNAYLNISDKQNPFGVTVTGKTDSGTFVSKIGVATDKAYQVSFTTAGLLFAWHNLVEIALDTSVASDYYGTYRAFLRCKVTGGLSTTWKIRLATSFGTGGGYTYTKEYFVNPVSVEHVCVDLGRVSIPTTSIFGVGSNTGDKLTLSIQGYATTTSVPLALYDLILVPVDEWVGDFQLPNALDPTISNSIEGENYLDVDSVSNPKTLLAAYNRTQAGLIKGIYQATSNGPVMLQKQAQQRIWFLAMTYRSASRTWNSDPAIVGGVMVQKVQRYLSLRGSN